MKTNKLTLTNPRRKTGSIPGLLPIFALIVLMAGCVKENQWPPLSEQYFPNEIGNRWVYDRYDSLAMERTTLAIDIVRDSTYKDGQTYRMWVFSKNNIYDTLYVRTTVDSVLFYRYLEGYPEEVMLKPLKVGLGWTHPYFIRDTTTVIGLDTLMVGYRSLPDAYAVQRRIFAFNDYRTDTRWFVPHLGIVKLENWHYLFGWISKENWYLKEYTVR